jgi:hypothetical protein
MQPPGQGQGSMTTKLNLIATVEPPNVYQMIGGMIKTNVNTRVVGGEPG